MSDIRKGRVTKVYENTFDDGGKSISFRLAGDPLFYRLGKKRFAGIVEEGNTIKFKAQDVSDKAAKVLGTPRKGTASASSGSSGDESGGGGSYGAAKEANIHYQTALKIAVNMVDAVLAAGAVKLPAKESAKLEVVEALMDRYTVLFFKDIETKGAVVRTAPPKQTEEPVAEAEEETATFDLGDDDEDEDEEDF